MVVKKLVISVGNCCGLTTSLGGSLGRFSNKFDYKGINFHLEAGNHDEDITFDRSFGTREPFVVTETARGTRRVLKCNLYTAGKDRNDRIVNELLKDTVHVKRIPTKWFNWNQGNQTFMERYHEVVESIPKDMLPNLSYASNGLVEMVLRPSNLTHAILAFRVRNPELFRFNLFDIIVNEVQLINNRRSNGKNVDNLRLSLLSKIKSCGLEIISENTFGQDGVYGDKYMRPEEWALTPYIEGRDIRVIKAGNKFWMHDGWLEHKKLGSDIIHPFEIPVESLKDEIATVMNNVITPVSGSLDLRYHPNDVFYYMETSHCYSSERYSENFNKQAMECILDELIRKHEELIGDFNEGWEDRLEEIQKTLDESGKVGLASKTDFESVEGE